MAKRKRGGLWIQKARKSMEKRGTVGAFGKATKKKVARAKAKGGLAEKRAVFAENMKKIAERRHRGGHHSMHRRHRASSRR